MLVWQHSFVTIKLVFEVHTYQSNLETSKLCAVTMLCFFCQYAMQWYAVPVSMAFVSNISVSEGFSASYECRFCLCQMHPVFTFQSVFHVRVCRYMPCKL